MIQPPSSTSRNYWTAPGESFMIEQYRGVIPSKRINTLIPNRVTADVATLMEMAAKASGRKSTPLRDAIVESKQPSKRLYLVFGERIQHQAVGSAATPQILIDVINPALAHLGKTLSKRVEQACYNLLCNDGDTGKKILDALKNGDAATYMAGQRPVGLGLGGPVTTVVVLLIVTLIVEPGEVALCEIWKQRFTAPALS